VSQQERDRRLRFPSAWARAHTPCGTPSAPTKTDQLPPTPSAHTKQMPPPALSGQSPLIINNAWFGVVVEFRTGTLLNVSGEVKQLQQRVPACFRKTFV